MTVNIYQKIADTTVHFHFTFAGADQAFAVISFPQEIDTTEAAWASYSEIARTLHEKSMEIVHERIFGSLEYEELVKNERRKIFSERGIPHDTPVTYIQGNPPWGEGLAGIIIRAVSAEKVWTIQDGYVSCGRGWRSNGCTNLMLQNLTGDTGTRSVNGSRAHQVRQMIERAERVLCMNGASYRDVVRTWFYLSDILDWYAEFNKVRNEKYGEFGIMPGPGDGNLLLPASTGISGSSSLGGTATMDLLAIVGGDKNSHVVQKLTNRVQLDAFRYGSAFSRGALIRNQDVSLLEISGTAAIDERGKSLFKDEVRRQITCAFDKIDSLLGQVRAELSDICAATVFVKYPEHAEVFWEMAVERGLKDLPAVCVVADVCRDELLFEIDGEAVVKNEFK
jgi:enamine deaminase RidA (YjgF/YER057c/UK114 family)